MTAGDRLPSTPGPAPADRHASWLSADRGDGTYRNPVLAADWSDPDVTRVGDDYYLTASSFGRVPGLPLLHSRDLVNWTLIGHALERPAPAEAFAVPRHDCGVWAPSIRYHDGRFWIFWGDPDHGIFQVSAEDVRGPWSRPHLIEPGKGLIDPCPLWDERTGEAYLVHAWARSRSGIKNRLTGHRMRPDATGLLDDGTTLIDADRIPGWFTLEGPKLYRHDGWFWILAPAGGVATGWQGAFRSREETCLNIASYGGTPQERAASVIADSYCWIRPQGPAERIAHHRGIAAVAHRILHMVDARGCAMAYRRKPPPRAGERVRPPSRREDGRRWQAAQARPRSSVQGRQQAEPCQRQLAPVAPTPWRSERRSANTKPSSPRRSYSANEEKVARSPSKKRDEDRQPAGVRSDAHQVAHAVQLDPVHRLARPAGPAADNAEAQADRRWRPGRDDHSREGALAPCPYSQREAATGGLDPFDSGISGLRPLMEDSTVIDRPKVSRDGRRCGTLPVERRSRSIR